MRRFLPLLLISLFLLLAGWAAWTFFTLPPLRLVLRHGLPPSGGQTGRTVTIEGVLFVELAPCYFRMGSTHTAKKGDLLGVASSFLGLPYGKQPKPSDEMPLRYIEFPDGFWIARTEVTNAQLERFFPEFKRNGYSTDDRHPVIAVPWRTADAYATWLAERSGLPLHLPSEAMWECACRAGSRTEYPTGDDPADLAAIAWFEMNSGEAVHEVATRAPNAWGLFDLNGNVWEWVGDTIHDSYDGAPADGSVWSGGSAEHLGRGGSWMSPAEVVRSAYRLGCHPGLSPGDHGIRPVFVLVGTSGGD
jgi:formylglycine-generating enzyme required for sulfatase activity